VDDAAQDLRSKLDGIRRDLPDDIDPPIVQKTRPERSADHITRVVLDDAPAGTTDDSGGRDTPARLEAVPESATFQVSGGSPREVRVNLPARSIAGVGITVPEVSAALSRQNLEVPAGRVRRGTSEQLVRVTGRITSPAQSATSSWRREMASRARERRGAGRGCSPEERSLALLDGKRAISINILKVSGRTRRSGDGVRAALDHIQSGLPPGRACASCATTRPSLQLDSRLITS